MEWHVNNRLEHLRTRRWNRNRFFQEAHYHHDAFYPGFYSTIGYRRS